jgi:hypothetical protein
MMGYDMIQRVTALRQYPFKSTQPHHLIVVEKQSVRSTKVEYLETQRKIPFERERERESVRLVKGDQNLWSIYLNMCMFGL